MLLTARDLIRTLSAKLPREETLRILHTLHRVLERAPPLGKELKRTNASVRKTFVDPPMVEVFLMQGFTREHVVDPSTGLNDFLYKPDPERAGTILVLAEDVRTAIEGEKGEEAWWWDELNVRIKVTLPNGEEMFGCFSPHETIGDLKEWVVRRNAGQEVILAAAWDPAYEYGDDLSTIGSLDLNKKRLIVKITGGDLGQAKMEAIEKKRREKNDEMKKERIEKFRKIQASKSGADTSEEKKRALNLQRFSEDRAEAETRAKREIAKIAGGSPTVATVNVADAADANCESSDASDKKTR